MPQIIFCPSLKGHRLEYLHHIYIGACNRHQNNYIIIVPSSFTDLMSKFEWPESSNVRIMVRSDIETPSSNIITECYNKSKLLGRIIKEYSPKDVFVLDLIDYVFLPLFVRNGVKLSGIIYRIFLYEWNEESTFKKIQDWLKYEIFKRFKVFDRVLILNDNQSAKTLNQKFVSTKFKYLPDPIALIHEIEIIDIRNKYSIDSKKKIFLHPGGMLAYKGTLEILKALRILDEQVCHRICLIFAGRITDEIKNEFYKLYEEVSNRVQIIIEPGFLSFQYLGTLFSSCDYVLIPYKTKAQSSGILGHAAFFKKPVIAVKNGVIGNIVEEYKLGYLIEKSSADCIKNILESDLEWTYVENEYVSSHSIESFNKVILD